MELNQRKSLQAKLSPNRQRVSQWNTSSNSISRIIFVCFDAPRQMKGVSMSDRVPSSVQRNKAKV